MFWEFGRPSTFPAQLCSRRKFIFLLSPLRRAFSIPTIALGNKTVYYFRLNGSE